MWNMTSLPFWSTYVLFPFLMRPELLIFSFLCLFKLIICHCFFFLICFFHIVAFRLSPSQKHASSWSWSYSSYLGNQCLSPLTIWVRIPLKRGVLDTTLCDVCQWLATGRWFSAGTLVFSTNKTYRHNITEILFKVVFNTINSQKLMDTEYYFNHVNILPIQQIYAL